MLSIHLTADFHDVYATMRVAQLTRQFEEAIDRHDYMTADKIRSNIMWFIQRGLIARGDTLH